MADAVKWGIISTADINRKVIPGAHASPKVDLVGAYGTYEEAARAWRAKAQATVDNALMRYFVIHAHRLLEPDLHDDPRFVLASVQSYVRTGSYSIGAMESRAPTVVPAARAGGESGSAAPQLSFLGSGSPTVASRLQLTGPPAGASRETRKV